MADRPVMICEVCEQHIAVKVCSMPGIPMSFAYCKFCLQANAHPYGIVVINTALIGGLDDAALWWKDIVQGTLTRIGKDREEFNQEVLMHMNRLKADLS